MCPSQIHEQAPEMPAARRCMVPPRRVAPWTACDATPSADSGARDTPAASSAPTPGENHTPSTGHARGLPAAALAPPTAKAPPTANNSHAGLPAQEGATSMSTYEAGLAGAILAGGVVLSVQWGLMVGCVYVGACGWLFAQTSPTVSRELREMRYGTDVCMHTYLGLWVHGCGWV